MDKKNNKIYDLIIVGTGPAGYTCSIYSSRYKIDHLLIGEISGGQISEAHRVCNFPGSLDISGFELGFKFKEQAEKLGAKEINSKVINISKDSQEGVFIIDTIDNNKYYSKTILLATGTKKRKLNIEGEEELIGKGLSYCATCDAAFFKNKIVGVVGGSDSATTAALLLSDIALKVYIIYRGSSLRGDPTWIEQTAERKNIEIILNTNITGLKKDVNLIGVILDKPYKDSKTINLDGLFVEIGSLPDTSFASNLNLQTDENGYINTSFDQSTNIKGLFAAGDITTSSNNFRQVVTACSEGAIASESIYKFLSQM